MKYISIASAFFFIVFLSLFILNADEPEGKFAERLNTQNVIAYAHMDLKHLVMKARSFANFVDEDIAGNLEHDISSIIEIYKEELANHEFNAEIFDHINDIQFHFLFLEDPEKNLFKSESDTSPPIFLAVETRENLAEDFMEQLRHFLDIQIEDEKKEAAYHNVDVEEGDLLTLEEQNISIGRLGNLLLLLNEDRQEFIWNYLLNEDPEMPISDTEAYQRYHGKQDSPLFFAFIDGALIAKNIRQKLEHRDENKSLESAESMDQHKNILPFLKNVLSLDQWDTFESAVFLEKKDAQTFHSDTLFALRHQRPLSPVMKLILDGGHELRNPGMSEDGIKWCFRLGLAEIYDTIVKEYLKIASPNDFADYQGAMAMTKASLGYSVSDLLHMLSGDFYLNINFVDKEYSSYEYDPEQKEFTEKKEFGPQPEIDFLIGLEKAKAFQETLGHIFIKLTNMGIGRIVKKTSFQNQEIYIIGLNGGGKEINPEAAGTVALAVVDEYLKISSWQSLTDHIRRLKLGKIDRALTRILSRYPKATSLFVMSRKALEKTSSLQKKNQEIMKNALDKLSKNISEKQNNSLEKKLHPFIQNFLRNYFTLNRKIQELYPEYAVAHSYHENIKTIWRSAINYRKTDE
jgi:hypothetical protein